ncbi:MAG: VOC family protein [Pseudomonadota bacterium]
MTEIFHLSLPVRDLDRSREFYETVLRATVGRVTDTWLDVWVFGAQVTLQQSPPHAERPASGRRFHLGGTLSWEQWRQERDRLQAMGAEFAGAPVIDEEKGQAKLYLNDPDGVMIELKAYRDIEKTLQPPR